MPVAVLPTLISPHLFSPHLTSAHLTSTHLNYLNYLNASLFAAEKPAFEDAEATLLLLAMRVMNLCECVMCDAYANVGVECGCRACWRYEECECGTWDVQCGMWNVQLGGCEKERMRRRKRKRILREQWYFPESFNSKCVSLWR